MPMGGGGKKRWGRGWGSSLAGGVVASLDTRPWRSCKLQGGEIQVAAALLVGTPVGARGRKEALRGNRLLQSAIKCSTPSTHPGRRCETAAPVIAPGCGGSADGDDMLSILSKATSSFGAECDYTACGARRVPGLFLGGSALERDAIRCGALEGL